MHDRPATREAFTHPYDRRGTANWVDFLEQVDQWLPAAVTTVSAIVDNLHATHLATDMLLFALAHRRWAFVFQPNLEGERMARAVPDQQVSAGESLQVGGYRSILSLTSANSSPVAP